MRSVRAALHGALEMAVGAHRDARSVAKLVQPPAINRPPLRPPLPAGVRCYDQRPFHATATLKAAVVSEVAAERPGHASAPHCHDTYVHKPGEIDAGA